MNMEYVSNYPLKDCDDCLHKDVCKWQAVFFRLMKKDTPLDLTTATCKAYIPESTMGDDGSEEAMEHMESGDVQSAIDTLVERYYANKLVPEALVTNINTFEAMKPHIEWVADKGLTYVETTNRGMLQVMFSAAIPDGQFYISALT